STGSTVSPAWTIAASDFWGIVAVEVLPPTGTTPVYPARQAIPPGWIPGRNVPGAGGIPFLTERTTQPPSGVTSTADTSLAVTASITADSSVGAGSSRQWLDQAGPRPRWAALLRNKTRRSRYFIVPETGLNTAHTSLAVTAGITADSVRITSADTSLTVTATITAAATAGGSSTQQIIDQPGSHPRWTALLRNKTRRTRYFTVPTTRMQAIDAANTTVTAGITAAATRVVSVDTSLAVTASVTADSSAGGESTRQLTRQSGSRPRWAALLRTKLGRPHYFQVPVFVPPSNPTGDASLTVTAGITAAVQETASANSSLTVTAGITAAAANVTADGASVTVTDGITAAAAAVFSAAASVTETAGITAAASETARGSASLTVTVGITAAANVGIAASLPVTTGITAAASEIAASGAEETVTVTVSSAATRVASADSSLGVTAGITADASDTRPVGSIATAVTAGITAAASVTGAASASVAVSSAI